MKCPKCEREMKQGYLQGGTNSILWVEKPHEWLLEPKKGEIFFNKVFVPAYICKSCKMLLSDYSETEYIEK